MTPARSLAAGLLAVGILARGAEIPAVPSVSLGPEDWDWVRNELVVRRAAQLDAEAPRYKKGDDLKIRLVTGTEISGKFDYASGSFFLVIRGEAESKQAFVDLDPADRVRIDPTFRGMLNKIDALVQARAIFLAGGDKEPAARENPGWDDLMKNGTLEELHAEARRILKTWSLRTQGPLDPGHAAQILSGLAPHRPEAAYELGVLLFSGQGIRKNGDLALQLIAGAAKDGVQEAYRFLDRYKVDTTRRDRAARDGVEWLTRQKKAQLLHRESILAIKAEREVRRKQTLGIQDPPPADPKKANAPK